MNKCSKQNVLLHLNLGTLFFSSMIESKQWTAYVVYECDQGCKEEVDWFPSYREANARINEITQDQLLHPQWYRHLADPVYVVRKEVRSITERDFNAWHVANY